MCLTLMLVAGFNLLELPSALLGLSEVLADAPFFSVAFGALAGVLDLGAISSCDYSVLMEY